MLVLSRKRDETIVIDDNIQITVVEVRGDRVRLGFTAPKDIPIRRSEVPASACVPSRQARGKGHGVRATAEPAD